MSLDLSHPIHPTPPTSPVFDSAPDSPAYQADYKKDLTSYVFAAYMATDTSAADRTFLRLATNASNAYTTLLWGQMGYPRTPEEVKLAKWIRMSARWEQACLRWGEAKAIPSTPERSTFGIGVGCRRDATAQSRRAVCYDISAPRTPFRDPRASDQKDITKHAVEAGGRGVDPSSSNQLDYDTDESGDTNIYSSYDDNDAFVSSASSYHTDDDDSYPSINVPCHPSMRPAETDPRVVSGFEALGYPAEELEVMWILAELALENLNAELAEHRRSNERIRKDCTYTSTTRGTTTDYSHSTRRRQSAVSIMHANEQQGSFQYKPVTPEDTEQERVWLLADVAQKALNLDVELAKRQEEEKRTRQRALIRSKVAHSAVPVRLFKLEEI